MERIDYLRDETTNALLIADGDFVRGDASFLHVQHIILSEVGENRNAVLLACGITRQINAPSLNKMTGLIKSKLTIDGFKVDAVNLVNGEIKVEAR